MKIIKFFGILVGIILGIIVLYLIFMTVADYRPKEKTKLTPYQVTQNIFNQENIKLTIFNIGYGALDIQADFFMEGGKRSYGESEPVIKENIQSFIKTLTALNSDFFLLQEVDQKARRSYYVNEYNMFNEALSEYESVFATNYKVPFVPVPLTKPYGYVHSGIATFSKYSGEHTRFQFPGKEKWPRQLALLDRCFIESKYAVGDKELLVINVHMSAYDAGGTIREQQVAYLKTYLKEKYTEGAYIIVGGDFNHELPGTNSDDFNNISKPDWLKTMTESFAGMTWHVQTDQPTSRSMEQPYVKGENYECIIDGFMISDNIELIQVETHDLGFRNSDHNPVSIEIKLK